MSTKERLSLLWIFVMVNMVMADIVGFMNPGSLEAIMVGDVGLEINQKIMLIFSILLEIPIAMIILSRICKYKMNRLLNIIASAVTIVFVIAGGELILSYLFFATIEVIAMIYILKVSWKWKQKCNE